jgi:hypothetical protein
MIRDEETRHKMTQDTPMSPQTTHPKGSMLSGTMTNGPPSRLTLMIDTKARYVKIDIQILTQEKH